MMKIRNVIAVAVENEKGEVLLFHRRADLSFHADMWYIVAGHIQEEETPDECMVRELKEEIGVEKFELLKGPIFAIDSESNEKYVFHAHLYRVKAKEKITIDPIEHDDHKWVKPSDALKYKSIPGLTMNLRKLGYNV
ncbi:MAG: NUDIX hydrolase [archaeon]